MIISTTNDIAGKRTREYLGVVGGETVMGANIVRDFFAGIRDVIGGRSGSYEKKLRQARSVTIDDMTKEASELGANAIIGIKFDYSSLGSNNSMLMVSATGTAVVVE